jgi:hypothetical protein
MLILSGCSLAPVAERLLPQAAQAADAMRNGAEYALCNGITVGAWRREYGADPRKAAGWALLCNPPTAPMPLSPPTVPVPQSSTDPIGGPHSANIGWVPL